MNESKKNTRDMLGRADIVSLDEALRLLHMHQPDCPGRIVSVSLDDALGRICAKDIIAPEDLPPYPRSTMDGYAVRANDTFGASEGLPAYLAISGNVQMGEYPETGPSAGSCYSIATGGILPPGTNAVVMLEHTIKVDEQMTEIIKPVAVGDNIINAGDDVRKGQVILSQGQLLRPQELGLLAGLGIDSVSVFRRVRVGIISTGDEIVPYSETPPPGKIRDMNGVNLAALVRSINGLPHYHGITADNEESLASTLKEALAGNDIALLSGSSSVGTRDLGEKVIEKIGQPGILLHGIAIKPGKPVIIARAGDKMVYGLPGHPVSAAVAFDLFVRPVLKHMSGRQSDTLPQHRLIKAGLARNLNSSSGRTDFVRVRLERQENEEMTAIPILGKSGALSTMVKAHGYIVIPEKQQGLREGQLVEVRLFDEF
jgi:molybdopterin molybdotransferase